jgi:superfamily II DNA or RNA helicase/HKD family nuclease
VGARRGRGLCHAEPRFAGTKLGTLKQMKPGLYELLVTQGLERAKNDDWELGPAASDLVADALAERLRHALAAVKDDAQRIELANRIVALLAGDQASGALPDDLVEPPTRALFAVRETGGLSKGVPKRPELSLRQSDLIVNGPRDLRLGDVIRRELPSADRVDILVSFLKWSGLRLVENELRGALERRPGCVRVLTTTYMRATEVEAVDKLREWGAEVRVSYDETTTRLHAKCWLFHRDSGFSTAVIGSSNLSRSALLDGAEWNVRVSSIDNRAVYNKLESTFAQYWADPAFGAYDRERFVESVRSVDRGRDALAKLVRFRPLPHQEAALEALRAERAAGHWRNLVVAATGTGKTVTAALDYVALRRVLPRARLLFVAHRREILEQSLATYRGALEDGHFGELHDGTHRPVEGHAVFASIQSLSSQRIAALAPDHYDVVVVDEFHHAAAPTYQALLGHMRPKVLLGLTATPERSDGAPIHHWFDGRVAYEMRLSDALDQQLLCPFHYFGIHDGTDLSRFDFRGGRYLVSALENLYTADDARALSVLREVRRLVAPLPAMRALGFCVSVKHAVFMADRFNGYEIAASVVTGDTRDEERAAARRRLERGELQVLFTVDVFNEGIDLPCVNTVLLLRPTESALLFQQQLGRGLRRHESKTALTVLDFIGTPHRQFRFDLRLRTLLGGGSTKRIHDEVREGFPRLPSGCELRLDKDSTERVVENLESQLARQDRKELAGHLRELGDVGLERLLRDGVGLTEVYARSGCCYTELAELAGLRAPTDRASEAWNALARLLHVDDAARLEAWRALLIGEREPRLDDPFSWMWFAALGFARHPVESMAERLQRMRHEAPLRSELEALLAVLSDRRRREARPCPGLPFEVHAAYARDEIAAGLRQARGGKLLRTQSGVYEDQDSRADVFYITLEKDERHFTPTTRYRDYPMTPTDFHWQSQAATRAEGAVGRRYREIERPLGWRTLLFVRQRRKGPQGETMPYTFLGPARFGSWAGDERPMSIVWHLDTPLPPALFQEIKVAAG